MRIKCLACEALARVVYLCAAHSPQIIDVELFRIGLHRDPAELRARLQARIDAANEEDVLPGGDQVAAQPYDAVALVYGLCGQSTAGLVARDVPLVIPRAHDCITLFLGDRERYGEAFREHPGTYWYALDYIERNEGSSTALGADADAQVQDVYQEYVGKYGEDNAAYLMEVMGAWQQHYSRAAFIEMGVGDSAHVEAHARTLAERRAWSYERVEGNLVLIKRLLDGEWVEDADGFLVVPPGHQVRMTYDADVLECAPAG